MKVKIISYVLTLILQFLSIVALKLDNPDHIDPTFHFSNPLIFHIGFGKTI